MQDGNKKLRKTTTNSREYNIASGKESWEWTGWIDRKPYRNWKLYRKTQYKENKAHCNRTVKNGEHWRYKLHNTRKVKMAEEIVYRAWRKKVYKEYCRIARDIPFMEWLDSRWK